MVVRVNNEVKYKLQLGPRTVNKTVWREAKGIYYYKHLNRKHYITESEIKEFKGELENEQGIISI